MVLLGFVLGVVFCGLVVCTFFGTLGNSVLSVVLSVAAMVVIAIFVIGSALGVQVSW